MCDREHFDTLRDRVDQLENDVNVYHARTDERLKTLFQTCEKLSSTAATLLRAALTILGIVLIVQRLRARVRRGGARRLQRSHARGAGGGAVMRASLDFRAPAFVPAPGGRFALARAWRVVYRGETYAVPAGFVTDGASIPAWIQWLCGSPWEAPRLYAALVHDFLYSGGDPEATRADADDIFRDLQISLGVPRWKAYVEWAALRLFGGSHWQGAKKEN